MCSGSVLSMCACVYTFTYQLKLPATIVCILYTRVRPQIIDGIQVLHENGRLQLPAGHLGRPGVERHQAVPILLVVRVTPGNVQLLPRVYQHTYAWRRSEDHAFREGPAGSVLKTQQARYK